MSSLSFSQNVSKDHFRNKVSKIENDLEYLLVGNKYVVYCSPIKLYLIIDKNGEYYELIYKSNYESDYLLYDINVLEESNIKKVFNKSNYLEGVVGIESDFYIKKPIESMSGLPTYFTFNTDYKQKYCEYYLSIFIKPVPMNFEVFKILSYKILNISDNTNNTNNNSPHCSKSPDFEQQ